jgi:DnaJ-class molecular chaperone
MNNFYELLQVNNTSSVNDIISSYKNKLSIYSKSQENNNLSSDQIKEIKLLKTAFYVLSDNNLRIKYDILIKKQQEDKKNSDFLPCNMMEDSNLDSVFNIDNTWMNQIDKPTDNNKKNRVEPKLLSERVFSLPQYAKKQNNTLDNDNDLRKPLQGRENKTI